MFNAVACRSPRRRSSGAALKERSSTAGMERRLAEAGSFRNCLAVGEAGFQGLRSHHVFRARSNNLKTREMAGMTAASLTTKRASERWPTQT
jgi:hypothetical protein